MDKLEVSYPWQGLSLALRQRDHLNKTVTAKLADMKKQIQEKVKN